MSAYIGVVAGRGGLMGEVRGVGLRGGGGVRAGLQGKKLFYDSRPALRLERRGLRRGARTMLGSGGAIGAILGFRN